MLGDSDGNVGFLRYVLDAIKQVGNIAGGIFIAAVKQLISRVNDNQLVVAILNGRGVALDFLNAGKFAAQAGDFDVGVVAVAEARGFCPGARRLRPRKARG